MFGRRQDVAPANTTFARQRTPSRSAFAHASRPVSTPTDRAVIAPPSPQAGIDDQRLFCDHAAVVDGEEQRGTRNLLAEQDRLQRLALHHHIDRGVRRVPELALLLGHDGARLDRVDAVRDRACAPAPASGR